MIMPQGRLETGFAVKSCKQQTKSVAPRLMKQMCLKPKGVSRHLHGLCFLPVLIYPCLRRAAGVFGFSWVAILHYIVGLSFTNTLLLANFTTIAWLLTFHLLLQVASPHARPTCAIKQWELRKS